MNNPIFKKCTQCQSVKPITSFSKDRLTKSGYNSACKDCKNESNKKWRETHKEYISKKYKDWRKSNKESLSEYNRVWREQHSESRKEYCKNWYRENIEKVKAYKQEHIDERRKYKYDCYHNDPVKQQMVKDDSTVQRHKRREKLSKSEDNFTKEQWNSLCAKYDFRCLACREKKKLTVDHVVPICKGGDNSINNIQCLCGSCNSKKGIQIIDYRY